LIKKQILKMKYQEYKFYCMYNGLAVYIVLARTAVSRFFSVWCVCVVFLYMELNSDE
jgi:hypothetical protein